MKTDTVRFSAFLDQYRAIHLEQAARVQHAQAQATPIG